MNIRGLSNCGYVLKNTAFLKGLPIGFITPHRGEIAIVGLVLECKAPRRGEIKK